MINLFRLLIDKAAEYYRENASKHPICFIPNSNISMNNGQTSIYNNNLQPVLPKATPVGIACNIETIYTAANKMILQFIYNNLYTN